MKLEGYKMCHNCDDVDLTITYQFPWTTELSDFRMEIEFINAFNDLHTSIGMMRFIHFQMTRQTGWLTQVLQ